MVVDEVRRRVLIFGGRDDVTEFQDVWALSLDATPAWTQLQPAGTPPDARHGHVAIWDPLRGRMLVHGGTNGSTTYGDLWELAFAVPTSATITPSRFYLHPSYPNPTNPSMSIRFDLAQGSRLRLDVFDVSGHRVRSLLEAWREAGSHTVHWNGADDAGHPVGSGVYTYRLEAGTYGQSRKLVLVR